MALSLDKIPPPERQPPIRAPRIHRPYPCSIRVPSVARNPGSWVSCGGGSQGCRGARSGNPPLEIAPSRRAHGQAGVSRMASRRCGKALRDAPFTGIREASYEEPKKAGEDENVLFLVTCLPQRSHLAGCKVLLSGYLFDNKVRGGRWCEHVWVLILQVEFVLLRSGAETPCDPADIQVRLRRFSSSPMHRAARMRLPPGPVGQYRCSRIATLRVC
jgi:hypothetical protein